MRLPVPAKMALATAGASAVVPRPLMPPGGFTARDDLEHDLRHVANARNPRPPKGRARGIPAIHSGGWDGRLGERPDQPRFDLLPDESRIDDAPAIDGGNQAMNLYALLVVDARRRDQADVRPEGRAPRNSHRASGPAAVPLREPRRTLQAARQPPLPPSIDIRKARGSMPAARANSSMKLSVKKANSRCGEPRM